MMRKICGFRLMSIFRKKDSPLLVGLCVGILYSLCANSFFDTNCVMQSAELFNGMRLSNIRDIRSNSEDDLEEDFEPIINLDENTNVNPNVDDKAGKLIRPRYYSTELGMKNKVLVSVISTMGSIHSFGIALNKTLNHYVDKLIFFLDGSGTKKLGLNIPIIGFKEHKPLIKVFRMLSYIGEYYINDYDYFLFVTDHSYVNGKRLMEMLEQITISHNVHMGKLQDKESLYCNLDSGIILSRSILEAVTMELPWCTKHTFSDSDSDNFGRCILHASNLPCKSTYQSQSFKSYAFSEADNDLSSPLDEGMGSSPLKKAVTVRGVEEPKDIFNLHLFYLQELILRSKAEIFSLRSRIEEAMERSTLELASPWPVGSPAPISPASRYDVVSWESFNETHVFMPNDFENVRTLHGVDRQDVQSVVSACVSHVQALSRRPLKFSGLRYGYRRFDPTRGMDYRLLLAFTDADQQILLRRLEAYRGLTQPEVIPMPYVTESTRVNMVFFVQVGEAAEATSFVVRFQKKVKVEDVSLTFYLLYNENEFYLGKDDPFKDLKEHLKKFSRNYYKSESRATFSHVVVPAEGRRPPSLAMADLALKALPGDALVFVGDVDASLDTDVLNRIRMNTIKNWQVFSPIPFRLYHPDLVPDAASYTRREVRLKNGHFDRFYFDQVGFYAQDYVAARASMADRVPIIRSEKDLKGDLSAYHVTIYEMFLAATELHVLRGVEPMLVLRYTPIRCPASPVANSTENLFCERRQALSLAERSTLAKLVYEYNQSKDGRGPGE